MSQKTKVQQIQPVVNGPTYGQVSNPADFQKSQIYSHQHIENVARDALTGGCGTTPQVAGFNYTLPGGMTLRINAPGQVVDLNGKSFDLIGVSSVDVVLDDADANQPRIDLVYALLEVDVDAALEMRPFVQLRTQQELEDGVAPYPPTQFNQPTEQHTRATVMVRTGTPADAPVSPDLQANEVPLYQVPVPANALKLTDVIDARDLIRTLRCAWKSIDELRADVNNIKQWQPPFPARDVIVGGTGPYNGLTVQDYIDGQSQQSETNTYDKLTRPETVTPELKPDNAGSGKIASTGTTDTGKAVVDLLIGDSGREVFFGKTSYKITPKLFPANVNARYVNKDVNQGTETRTNSVSFSLASINSIESDGEGDYTQKTNSLAYAPSRSPYGGRCAAARDGRYIEVFGGNYVSPNAGWYTYDTVGNTFTQRTFTNNVPTNPIVFAAPCGNGKILIAELGGAIGTQNGSTLRWYLLDPDPASNASNCTRKNSGPGGTNTDGILMNAAVVGDLIQSGVIFLVVAAPFGSGNNLHYTSFYKYDVGADTFTQLTPVGQGPTFAPQVGAPAPLRNLDCCLYMQGQAMIFQANPAKTLIFDLATVAFTTLNISQPSSDKSPTQPMTTATVANVNGRPQMVSEFSSVWELTPGSPSLWNSFPSSIDSDLGTRALPGFASLLLNGLPNGIGYIFGGVQSQTGQVRSIRTDVWQFAPGGVIQTVYNGVTGLTLAPGATTASFRIADLTGFSWSVATVLASLVGLLPSGSVKLSYSFDGVHYIDVARDSATPVTSSSNPAIRSLKITLIGAGTTKPILTGLTEQFIKTAASGTFSNLYIRIDLPTQTNNVKSYMFLNRDGTITIEAAFAQSTADKALLSRFTGQGAGVTPLTWDYVNKRRISKKYTGTKSGGVDPSFGNDLPVDPARISSFKIAAGGAVSDLADPTWTADGTITVLTLANTDSYRILIDA